MSELILPGSVAAPPTGKIDSPESLMHVLGFAMQNYLERMSIFPVDGLLIDSARANDKRPAYLKVATVDSVVKNINGTASLRDLVLIIRVPREIVDRALSPVRTISEA